MPWTKTQNIAGPTAVATATRLGGVKIGWGQTLLHALLAGLLTALITYLAMEPGYHCQQYK